MIEVCLLGSLVVFAICDGYCFKIVVEKFGIQKFRYIFILGSGVYLVNKLMTAQIKESE